MSDYGIRVSKKGKDVFNDEDLDMALTSKYANLKGTKRGGGNINISGETKTITIPHNLSYIPFAKAYAKEDDNGARILPYRNVISSIYNFQEWKYWHYCDDTNLYIKLFTTETLTIYYTYWIFYDKGKL